MAQTLACLGTEAYADFLAHAICLVGHCSFTFNGRDFELTPGPCIRGVPDFR